jgi:competence protein ComFC
MTIVLPQVAELKRLALDMLFPPWCIGCGKENEYICPACRKSLKAIVPPVCLRCGRPILPEEKRQEGCQGCINWQNSLDGLRAPFLFESLVRDAVHELKYNNFRAISCEMARLMYEYFRKNPIPGDVLVPVPLHYNKLHDRGYNQSTLLVKEFGRLCGLPVIEKSLVRMKYTPAQARSVGVKERQENVSGAFFCRDYCLRGKKVILIDDVSTSGATLNACASALKEKGTETVWGLTFALEL